MRRLVRTGSATAYASLVAVLLGACGGGESSAPPPVASPPSAATAIPAPPPPAATSPAPRGIDRAAMDTAVRPGADFDAYASGSWMRRETIPADESFSGGFRDVRIKVERETHEILEEAAAGRLTAPSEAANARLAGDFYGSFMDVRAVDALGVAPLAPALAAIAAVHDKRALATWLGHHLRADVDALNTGAGVTHNLLGLWAEQDLNDPSRVVPYLLQGGLGLPDRSYYLDATPEMKTTRAHYIAHVTRLLQLAGVSEPERKAALVMALETKIATAHAPHDSFYEAKLGNNPWKREDFRRLAPGMDWEALFTAAQLGAQHDFIVWRPQAVTGLSRLVAEVPLATWKAWMAMRVVEHAAPFSMTPLADEQVTFETKELQGIPQAPERWKLAVATTNKLAGDAIGQLYVARHFSPESKREIEAMSQQMIHAFARRIDALTWMAPDTKTKAKAKLASIYVGIGYPDRWREYRDLEIRRGDLLGNVERAEDWKYRESLARLGKPADKRGWEVNAHEVDAMNLPVRNSLNFPAAFLQAPFYSPGASAAINFGTIGAVIGHEISHSFDNTGALFDPSGKLQTWWTPDDLAHFAASTAAIVTQYDAYRPFPDLAENGRQTAGENIADLAGLAAAHDAWRESVTSSGAPAPLVDGFDGEQQFFLGYAQAWRFKARDELVRLLVATDQHAIPKYRIATFRNLDAWYAAFDVKPGDALYLAPEARVRVW